MLNFLIPFTDRFYAVLRIVAGFLFLQHGSQKLFGFPTGEASSDSLMYVAGTIELVGGILIMIGWQTRSAAFLCSGLMAAAYWMAHGLKAPLPIANHGELAVLYCFIFLYMAGRGSGVWSVDSMGSEKA